MGRGSGEALGNTMTVTSIGLDIIEIERVRRALARQPRLAARLFTSDERAYCDGRADPASHYSARFAAKEAVAKAVGHHLRWQEVEIVSDRRGRPSVTFLGESAAWAGVTRGARCLLSLTHSRDYAAAVVVMLSPPPSLPEDEPTRSVLV